MKAGNTYFLTTSFHSSSPLLLFCLPLIKLFELELLTETFFIWGNEIAFGALEAVIIVLSSWLNNLKIKKTKKKIINKIQKSRIFFNIYFFMFKKLIK